MRIAVVLLAILSVALAQQYEGINTGEGLQSLLFPGNGGIELATTPGRATLSQSLPLSFTFESWVMLPNPPADGYYKTIVSRYDIGLGRNSHNRWADFNLQCQASGTLNVFFGNGLASDYGIIIFGGQLVQGQWAHIAFSVSHTGAATGPASSASLYYNNDVFTKPWIGAGQRNLYPQRSVFLGDYFNQDGDHKYWLGYMDEVRFWSGVRFDSQVTGLMQRVVPANSAGLLAYYRFNDAAGLYLQDATANRFDGQLYKVTASTTSPLWRVSGAKIHVDVSVTPGSVTNIYLPGYSPSGAFTFTYAIESLPVTAGTTNGTGRLLADTQIITTAPFALISNQVAYQAPPTPGVLASFTYYGTSNIRDSTAKEASSTRVFVQIGAVDCPRDACGQCNGDNSTCSCLPLPYNGYNLNDVQRMLLLYEIEQTLALLGGVQSKLEATLTMLSAHQVAELQTIINEVQLFGSSCLMAFCDNVQGYLDILAAIGPN